MVNQKIDGDNNTQIGEVHGSLFIDKRRPHFLPNDPNVIDCPHNCGQQTWFTSEKCWNCDRSVKQHLLDLAWQKQREQFKNKAFDGGVTAVGISIGIYIVSPYLPESISAFTSLFSLPLFMFGIVRIGQSIRA
tara:strand:+ start:13859 stop:14257 length:399 start_codon:yes stop_codon:yes gene_type:complete